MKGYKVVRKTQYGEMLSCYSPSPVRYEFGVARQPVEGDGPLAVFRSWEWADMFIMVESSLGGVGYQMEIHPCEYEPWEGDFKRTDDHNIPFALWSYDIDAGPEPVGMWETSLPYGTALAKSVTLIKK